MLLASLQDVNFKKLLIGQVISVFGDRVNQTALLSIVVYVTGNTAKYSADILFWAVLPLLIFSPFTMALVDRFDRRKTLIFADVARALLVSSLPLLMLFIKHYYVVYATVFLVGCFTAFFNPCRLAMMPNILPSRLLMPANAIFSQAILIVTLVAMPSGGFLVDKLGHVVGFLLNGATYLLSAIFILQLHPSTGADQGAPLRENSHPFLDFRDGFLYTWKNRPIFFQIIFFGIMQCLVAIFFIAFLSYGIDVLHLKVGGTNLLFAALGIGMALGAFCLGHSQNLAELPCLPMLMMGGAGIGMVTLSRVTSSWLGALVLFGIGFCAAMVMIPPDTYLQKHVPDNVRGRVFAVRGVLVGGAFLISLQLSKALIHHLGTPSTLRWLGIASILLGGIIALIWNSKTRQTPSQPINLNINP